MGWLVGVGWGRCSWKFTNIKSTSPLLTLWNGIIIYRKGWGGMRWGGMGGEGEGV